MKALSMVGLASLVVAAAAFFACDTPGNGTDPEWVEFHEQWGDFGEWPREAQTDWLCQTNEPLLPPEDPKAATTGTGELVSGVELARLRQPTGCAEALSGLKRSLRSEMRRQLEANLDQALSVACQPCQEQPEYYGWCDTAASADAGAMWPGPADPESPTEESAEEYSTTNVQVADVDEADFIKNDGSTIFVLADGKLQVIDAWPAPQAHLLATVPIDGTPKRMFFHGNRVAVFSSLWPVGSYGSYGNVGNNCSYGYDCEFRGDGQATQISVFDVSDLTKPELVREIRFSGAYVSSRRINDIVHTVLFYSPDQNVPHLPTWPDGVRQYVPYCDHGGVDWLPPAAVRERFEQLLEENERIIDELGMADLVPGLTDTRYVDGQPHVDSELFGDCSGFYLSQADDRNDLIALFSFDLLTDGDVGHTAVVGSPGAVYASTDALYMAQRRQQSGSEPWYYEPYEAVSEATTFHKFRLTLDETSTSYVGSGVVKGRVLNQFAMDEHHGNLRIATTTGRVPSPSVHSTISVIAEGGETGLEVVGQLDQLAPTEDIRSVRFNGDVGYVVTFKKTDPLFVLDLSDPKAPSIKGELKIPGYSTYMHIMDEGHVLAIGYDAEDHGDFAYFQGIQLQIFDVTQLNDPKLMHKETIGTRGTSSDAALDHMAFNWFAPRQALAIPMVICEESNGGGSYGDVMTFNGLLVYRVTYEHGFELLGGVPHVDPGDGQVPAYGVCSSWWTESDTLVKRSVFMDDYVYSVAPNLIQVSSLADLEHPVASVDLVK